MYKTTSWQEKLTLFFKIMLPVLITQVGLFAMNFFDTIMSGQASPADLAGVAIATGFWIPIFTGLSGILLALTPIVSHLVGKEKTIDVPFNVIQSIYLAMVMTIGVIVLGILTLNPVLNYLSLEENVRVIAKKYLFALSFGFVPLFIYTVLRSFMDGLGQTRITMFITLIALPVNVLFNYFLIFGKFGFPKLGGVGAGYATTITYWFIFIITIFVIHFVSPFAEYNLFKKLYPLSMKIWKEILVIGIPIGFTIFFETSIFSAVTLFMSQFDTNTIAAHQAALNFASFLYMVPLSVSMALTITVGFEIGAKRYSDARRYSQLGIGFAILLALASTILLLLLREEIASLYTNDTNVLQLTMHFLIYAIFFQFADAIGAPIQGALRGYKDVNFTFLIAFISFWVVGLPFGYYLATTTSEGPFGYWIGLITGLVVGAILLFSRLLTKQKSYQ